MEKETMKQHGAFSWNELMTNDIAGAKKFYGELFGWQMRDEPMPDIGAYTTFKTGDRNIAGMMADAEGAPPAWGAYVTVDDIDQQVARVEQLGGKIILPPREIPNVGRFAVISDPQGAMLTMITYSEQSLQG